MANEAVIIELLGNGGDPVRFTCASGTAITKGTLMEIDGDPRTVSANDSVNDKFVGIAAADKASDDFATTIACYTNGIFDLTIVAGGTATLGQSVKTSGANLITVGADADYEAGTVVGKALETGTTGEVIAVRVLV